MDRFYSTTQVAEIVGVDASTIRRWIDAGKLRAQVLRTGERPLIRVKETELRAFVARYSEDPTDETGDEG